MQKKNKPVPSHCVLQAPGSQPQDNVLQFPRTQQGMFFDIFYYYYYILFYFFILFILLFIYIFFASLSDNTLLVFLEEKNRANSATLISCNNFHFITMACWELAEDIVFEGLVISSKPCTGSYTMGLSSSFVSRSVCCKEICWCAPCWPVLHTGGCYDR